MTEQLQQNTLEETILAKFEADEKFIDLMVDEGMLYVFTQMLLIAWLECIAHGGSQAL